MFQKTWDPKTKEGKGRIKALSSIVENLKTREELGPALDASQLFKDMRHITVYMFLQREASRKSPLGNAWKRVPVRPNAIQTYFPDESKHDQLRKDMRTLPTEEFNKKYPVWPTLSRHLRESIYKSLDTGRDHRLAAIGRNVTHPPASLVPMVTVRNWWLSLPTPRREKFDREFLGRYRSDYRQPGNTNADIISEWPEALNYDGLRHAARALSETRNRLQIANEIGKSTKRNQEITDIWKIQGLEARCRQLVQEGWLTKTGGLQHVLQTVNTEFAVKLGKSSQLTKRALVAHLAQLVWTQEIQIDIRRAIRSRLLMDQSQIEEFRTQYYPWIPEKMWKRKVKFFKGLSDANLSANFVAGVGRLITDELGPEAERFEFPQNDFAHPLEIPVDGDWNMPVVNGAHIGIVYDPNIEDNPLRRALSDARKRGAARVVVTNLINLYVKKTAGVGHIYRAQVSGLHIKLEHLPEGYREKAARIMRERPDDEVVYQNIAARFLGILDALFKIFNKPDKKGPEYTGKVIYPLGYLEEELINEAANAELRYIRILNANRLGTEIQIVNRRVAKTERETNWEEVARLELRQRQLSEELAMTILTNVSDEDRNRQRRRIRALFVKKVQEVIPNCTVVSQGSINLKIGDKTVKVHIPANVDVTDGHLASYGDGYGAEVFRDTLADLTVICHPYAFNHRLVGREDSKDGQPITKFIRVAPLCLDDAFLRDQLKDATKEMHPIQRCVHNPQFKPGVLLISCINGILSAYSLPIAKLDHFDPPRGSTNFAFPYPETKYITWFLNTDNHFGAPDKRYIWDPKERIHLGATEATIEMMRREGMVNQSDIGIHCTAEMDDATNGDMWFQPRYRQWPQEMSIIHIERWLRQLTSDLQRAAERGDMEAVRRMTEEINRVSIAQHYFKGEDFPFAQMEEVYDRHIDPNVDFYSAILGRFVKSGLIIRGVSTINRTMSDMRDLGVHNFPEGNHRISSLDQKDLEGDHVARHLREKLAQLPIWQRYLKEHPNFLLEKVRAPRFGNMTFGWGIMQAPNGFEWGVRVHGSPARQSGWSDILAAVVKSDLARGDDTYGLLKHKTITFFGDKHFYAEAETAHITYIMCAAGVRTSQYGSSGGFPPNNTGTAFVSIPAGGPEEGPIIMQMMPHDILRDWFANPQPFNWKKFLPKPV